jgi:hypothetical protein
LAADEETGRPDAGDLQSAGWAAQVLPKRLNRVFVPARRLRGVVGAWGLLAALVAGPAAGQPAAGGFSGLTSQGRQYNFTVASGGTSLSYLFLDARIANCHFTFSTGSIPVTGGQFSETYGTSCVSLVTSGTFSSPSAAAGTFSITIPTGCTCAGSTAGTWATYGPPASLCPAGSAARNLFFDGFENPFSGAWTNTTLSGVNHWNGCAGVPDVYCTSSPRSGAYHLWGRDAYSIGDSAVAMSPVVGPTLPAGARMQFDHLFSFEWGFVSGSSNRAYFDGAVLEYSTNGGGTWQDAGSLIAVGPRYRAGIYGGFGNPLRNRAAFVGMSAGYTASQLDLASLAGKAVEFRFRVGTDSSVSATGWYVDNVRLYDCVTPTVSVSDAFCTEGDAGTTPCAFSVALSSAVGEDVSVAYTTADGSARAGVDYYAATGTVVIPAGDLSAPIPVAVIGDLLDEANETFVVQLTGAPKATIADGLGVGTILDDDPTPSLAIADAVVTEGNSGTMAMNFAVSLSAPSGLPVTFRSTTADGTATAGSDFEATSEVMEILPGQTAGWVSVPVLGDRVAESTEYFTVDLTEPGNVTFANSHATGTINDDDPAGLSVGDVSVVEPRTGTKDAVFTVAIAPAPAGTVTVDYATEDDTAVSPADYAAASGQLSFDAANVTRTVSVAVNADSLAEGSETFKLRLSNPSGAIALVYGGVGTGRILDPGNFHSLKPCRLIDTRWADGPLGGPRLLAGTNRVFTIGDVCGVPSTATAVSVNMTVTGPTVAGHLRLYPAGAALPLVSSVNYAAGQTRANNGIVPLGPGGQIAVWCAQASGTTEFILDVSGYFE